MSRVHLFYVSSLETEMSEAPRITLPRKNQDYCWEGLEFQGFYFFISFILVKSKWSDECYQFLFEEIWENYQIEIFW